MLDPETVVDAFNILTAIITAAAVITAATKSPRDDEYISHAQKWLVNLRKVLNVLGFNVGHAKNKEG